MTRNTKITIINVRHNSGRTNGHIDLRSIKKNILDVYFNV